MGPQKKIANSTYTSQTFGNCQGGVYQHVTIGGVAEVCQEECRFILTPSVARELIHNGHKVCIQAGAGNKAGFQDEMYRDAGVTVLPGAEAVYKQANIILKVRQPESQELSFIQPHQVVFCFVDQTKTLFKDIMQRHAIIIGYQYLQHLGSFPVFNAVAELMGYLGVQQAMKWLETQGKVLGQLGGFWGSHVLVLGAGVCGIRAAFLAAGAGAHVTVMDTCVDILREAAIRLPGQVFTIQYTTESLEQILPTVDVVIGAALSVIGEAPVLVSAHQMKLMHQDAFAIDLAVALGGNFEVSKSKSLHEPITQLSGVTLFTGHCITNLAPHAFATTVGNAVLPWVLQVANKGWKRAVLECHGLQHALCVVEDRMTSQWLAGATQLPYTPVEQVLEHEIQQLACQHENNVFKLKQQMATLRIQQGATSGCLTGA